MNGPNLAFQELHNHTVNDDRFHWMDKWEEPEEGVLPWYWRRGQYGRILKEIKEKKEFVVGPFVIFSSAYKPQRGDEIEILNYTGFKAIAHHGSWYCQYARQYYKQKHGHFVMLGTPVSSDVWETGIDLPKDKDIMIYIKKEWRLGEIPELLMKRLPDAEVVEYSHHTRKSLVESARRHKVCIYLAHFDNNPTAVKEIMAAGCAVISHDIGCPLIIDGVNGYNVSLWADDPGPMQWKMIGPDKAANALANAAVGSTFNPDIVIDTLKKMTDISQLVKWILISTGVEHD